MSFAEAYAACAHAYERGVAAAAEYGGAFFKTQLLSRLCGQTADVRRAVHYLGKVSGVNVEQLADLRAPAFVTLADIIEQGAECGIPRHDEFARHAADYVFLDIEPFIDSLEILGFIVPEPAIFPDGVLDAGGDCAGDYERGNELALFIDKHEALHL